MTPEQAEALAARTLAAIPAGSPGLAGHPASWLADRERVASDLAGLRECCRDGYLYSAHRYADNLRRTAALYGVTE